MSHSVLIADDSLFIREALCNLFEREEDFDVCGEAKNGKEAVEKARELHPDLILLDLSMQVMNGLDATRVLKRLMPDVPVIMFSLYSGPSTEKEARSAGASALVSKLEHVSVLLGKARSALEPKNHESSSVQAPLRPQSSVVRSSGNHHQPTGRYAIMPDAQLARGDICADPTGLRVRVENVDICGYVHFSVIERSDSGEDEAESGQMSRVAFVHRFTKLGNMFANRRAA